MGVLHVLATVKSVLRHGHFWLASGAKLLIVCSALLLEGRQIKLLGSRQLVLICMLQNILAILVFEKFGDRSLVSLLS